MPEPGVRDNCGRAEDRGRGTGAFWGRLFEAEELDFRLERNAISFQYLPLDKFDQRQHIAGRRIPRVHDEVRMDIGDARAADGTTFEPRALDQIAR